jgi:hypothetical protein
MKIVKWNGRPISKPGWYSNIPIEKYHSAGMCDGPAVSSTNLRTCWSKSAAHMYSEWCENPKAEPRESTRNMILGSAAHHLFLGEDGFNQKFIQQPLIYRDKKTAEEKPWNNNAEVCKKWNAEQAKLGRTIVTTKELDAIKAMAWSMQANPFVQNGILEGEVEVSGFVKDQETGLWIKVRPDVIPTASGDYVDLKTAAEVTTPALQYSIRSYGYNQQGALVGEVAQSILTDIPFASFWLMFIETAKPYCARAVRLTDEDLKDGNRMNRWAMRKIALCLAEGRWPGPGEDEPETMGISNDERARVRARLEREGLGA